MKKPSSVLPESNTVTMFGWSILAWIWPSRWNRWMNVMSSVRCDASTLSATTRSSDSCVAS